VVAAGAGWRFISGAFGGRRQGRSAFGGCSFSFCFCLSLLGFSFRFFSFYFSLLGFFFLGFRFTFFFRRGGWHRH
jgi:hypothetical protein